MLFFKKPESPKYIMLSGLPCVGKSTWRAKMLTQLRERRIALSVLSADDMIYEMCNEHNRIKDPSEAPLTYDDIFIHHRDVLEARYKNTLIESKKQDGGFVILDRTHLIRSWRRELLVQLSPCPVHAVIFDIADEARWHQNLLRRNATDPSKNITDPIIELLKKGASRPVIEEGFASISVCKAVGEIGWEATFDETVNSLVGTTPAQRLTT